MGSIEKQFVSQVESLSKIFVDSDKVKEFEKSSEQFEKLVEAGVTRKRGYNLLSPTDAHKSQVWFNAIT